jgi:hypothetical protein
MIRSFSIPAALLLLGALTGCDTAGLKRSYLALDSQGDRRRTAFFTDSESIFCIAELASGVTDVTVEGVFEQHTFFSPDSGEPIPLQRFVGMAELAPGAGEHLVTAFELTRAVPQDPYTAGEYSCSLYINGDRESVLRFEIRYPDCPATPVEAGIRCAGFVLNGSSCPGTLGQSCVCGAEGLWECP